MVDSHRTIQTMDARARHRTHGRSHRSDGADRTTTPGDRSAVTMMTLKSLCLGMVVLILVLVLGSCGAPPGSADGRCV